MSFEDSDCYGGLSSPQDFGIITFGGANPQHNHYFVANGNSASGTSATESMGSRFIAGVPMRLFRLTCHKSTAAPANAAIHVIRNGQAHELLVVGHFDQRVLGANFTLSIGDVLQVRSRVTPAYRAPGAALVSLYFYPLSQQTPLYSEPESSLVNIMTFSGANANARDMCLRFNGSLTTNTNSNENDVGNHFVVGAPMVVRRMTWQKSTPGISTIFIWGLAENLRLLQLGGVMGASDILRPLILNAGDVIRLESSIDFPGTCTVSLYAGKL
jgi:hypothetical protein